MEAIGPEKIAQVENRGYHLEKFWSPGAVHPTAPIRAPALWDSQFGQHGIPVPMLALNGDTHTRLFHPHPPTQLDLLLHHPLPRKAYRQGGWYHRWEGGSR